MSSATDRRRITSPLPVGVRLSRLLHAPLIVVACALFLISVLVVTVGTRWLGVRDPLAQDLAARLQGPSKVHPLGTDGLGRDVLSRLLYGSRVSVVVGVLSVFVSGAIGLVVGLTAGFYRRWVDDLIMRALDIQQAIPPMMLAIVLAAVLGPSLRNVIIVLAITRWIVYARVMRAEVLRVREQGYVEAAQAVGVTPLRIAIRHILPNAVNPVLVVATLEVSRMIILESSLSFLGLGVQPPTPTWGAMISDARDYLTVAWWIAVFPGLAIFLTVLSINLVGDWLRELMDPRFARQRVGHIDNVHPH